jgi:hypothetical protein
MAQEHALVPRAPTPEIPALLVAPGPEAPSIGGLFAFMRDAELRFDSLRMRLVDRTFGAAGEKVEAHELWLRTGRAKVVTRFDENASAGASRIWISDGATVRTFDTRSKTTSTRPVRERVRGATDPRLPAFGRVYAARTYLPPETLIETFVHPHGFCRNVLATGDLALLGTSRLDGREVYLVRSDHPRTTKVLTDRPDHWLEIAVDRLSGLIVLLIESVAGEVTRRAEATALEVDAPIPDTVFDLHLGSDARRIF